MKRPLPGMVQATVAGEIPGETLWPGNYTTFLLTAQWPEQSHGPTQPEGPTLPVYSGRAM